mmetsp:Transcript_2988/g.9508  ORF Transcript_2988/g.9508 Transcript_2988/m.9508 type:complete len:281 (-) Transcript_2988:118-960(-)
MRRRGAVPGGGRPPLLMRSKARPMRRRSPAREDGCHRYTHTTTSLAVLSSSFKAPSPKPPPPPPPPKPAAESKQQCAPVLVDEAAEDSPAFSSKCSHWAATGECFLNPTFMLSSCARSCRDLAPADSLPIDLDNPPEAVLKVLSQIRLGDEDASPLSAPEKLKELIKRGVTSAQEPEMTTLEKIVREVAKSTPSFVRKEKEKKGGGKGGEGKASKKKKGESKGGGKAAAQGGAGDDDYAYAKVLIEELRPIYERLPTEQRRHILERLMKTKVGDRLTFIE